MKSQATRTEPAATKQPFATRLGRGLTKATMGTSFWLGRTGAKVGKNFVAGVIDAGREVKRGYDEGKADA